VNATESGPPQLDINVAYLSSSIVVTVTGEIDMSTAAQLLSTLIAAIDAQRPQSLTIDIAGVSVLAAAGMTALIQTYEYARRQHISIGLINPQPLVGRAIEIVGLTQFLRVSLEPTGP
jgi:anti-anti-sigma factor